MPRRDLEEEIVLSTAPNALEIRIDLSHREGQYPVYIHKVHFEFQFSSLYHAAYRHRVQTQYLVIRDFSS